MRYILITSARDEAAYIEETIRSVVSQTQLPERWVIVVNGSLDKTAEIVAGYARANSWMTLVQNPRGEQRSFAIKADSVNAAFAKLRPLDFAIVGNLDADVSFAPDYMEFLLQKLGEDPALGVAGTPFIQEGDYDSTRDSFEGENYVAGPCQLFRRECFSDIGGYVANPAGGVDWIAVMTARMKGWKVRSFADKRYYHLRSMGTAGRSEFAALFSYGEKDYYLGNSPLWQLFRVSFRTAKRPRLTGGLALGLGYLWAAIRRVKRPISEELVRFHRTEQMRKLRAILGGLLKFKRVDSFRLEPASKQSH